MLLENIKREFAVRYLAVVVVVALVVVVQGLVALLICSYHLATFMA